MRCRCCCVCTTELVIPQPARAIPPMNGGPRCDACEAAHHVDAARRASEIVNLHLLADREQARRSWIAIRLSDGGSDNVLYPTRHDAVRHQLHETLCAYLEVTPDGLPVRAAEAFLRFNRQLYDNGFRMTDPDRDFAVVMPLRKEDVP